MSPAATAGELEGEADIRSKMFNSVDRTGHLMLEGENIEQILRASFTSKDADYPSGSVGLEEVCINCNREYEFRVI